MTDEKHSTSPPPYSIARRHPRYKMDVRVRVSIPRNHQLAHARSADVSEGGLGFFAPIEMEVGEKIRVEFTMPYTREPLRCSATVRNRNGYRYGVEFSELDETARQSILRASRTLSLLG